MTEMVKILRDGEEVQVPADTVLPPPLTLPQAKAVRLAGLAAIRYQRETGGIPFVYQGQAVTIPTGREDVAQAFMAESRAKEDPDYTRNIKLRNGLFVPADAATILVVAGLIDQHVQACFDREAVLTAQIVAAPTTAALDAIDIMAGW